jgi:hypothetical protein
MVCRGQTTRNSGGAMGARADALAERFHESNGAVIAFVERCDEDLWRAPVHDDGRQVNVVAHHIAEARIVYPPLLASLLGGQRLAGILDGTDGDPDAAWAAVHAYNAAHDAAHQACTREEVLAALRELIAVLSDADLDHAVAFPYSPVPVSGQQLIERLPIGHPRFHLVGLEATREALRRDRTLAGA